MKIKSILLGTGLAFSLLACSAKDADIEKAMKIASLDMINKVSSTKKISREDVYTLASFAMDCRIAPYVSGDKEVHCTLAKNLWVS